MSSAFKIYVDFLESASLRAMLPEEVRLSRGCLYLYLPRSHETGSTPGGVIVLVMYMSLAMKSKKTWFGEAGC